ncbi:MAG: hypothetical protein ACJ74Q_13810, partial [Pyrinomonadaceae bacterium]
GQVCSGANRRRRATVLLIIPIQFVEISPRIFGPSTGLPVTARRHHILNVGSHRPDSLSATEQHGRVAGHQKQRWINSFNIE